MIFKRKKRTPTNAIDLTKADALAISPFSSKKEQGFTVKAKNKLDDKFNKGIDPKYTINEMSKLNTGTASPVYKVKLDKGIGSWKAKTKSGYAKKRAEDGNASAANLNITGSDTRMIARQIASWKLARSLNIRVLSNEKYAYNVKSDGKRELLGVSASLPQTAQSLSAVLKEQRRSMLNANLDANQMENYLGNTIFSGRMQKQLSDLQIMDALTGQTDRHHGNIYLDVKNQRVYGIDNDQAFGTDLIRLNEQNAIGSFHIKTTQVQGSVTPKFNSLEYIQDQIDVNTAEKILNLDDDGLESILKSSYARNFDENHDEVLNSSEIAAAKVRLAAIKTRIQYLKDNNQLITTWDHNTYSDAITINKYGGLVGTNDTITATSYVPGQWANTTAGAPLRYRNYIAREVNRYVHSKTQYGRTVKWEDDDL